MRALPLHRLPALDVTPEKPLQPLLIDGSDFSRSELAHTVWTGALASAAVSFRHANLDGARMDEMRVRA